MSPWQPCKRRVFIKRLRNLGFEGPFSGTRHQFMVFENYRLFHHSIVPVLPWGCRSAAGVADDQSRYLYATANEIAE